MDVYIDIAYLANVILGCLCLLTLSVLTGQMLSLKKLVSMSLFWGLHLISLYSLELLYYIWVILICICFDRKHIVRNILIFLFIHETYLNSLKGIYRIGHILIVTTEFDWMLPLLFSFLLVFFYVGIWFQMRKETLHQALCEWVKIKWDDHMFEGKGFMDTGNQAVYDGLPIIFVKANKISFSSSIPIHMLVRDVVVDAIKGEIYYRGNWQPCMIATMIEIDMDVDVLLNYNLL